VCSPVMKTGELQSHYGLLLGLVPPWAVVSVDLDLPGNKVVIEVNYPPDERVPCPECGRECRIRDHREKRTWRHLDTMQFETLVTCRVPRSDCPEHGAKTILVPWAGARSQFTLLFERFAIEVLLGARSIKKAQEILGISWDQAQRIQELAVERGILRRRIEGLRHVGVDEKSFGRGQSYVSVMTDIDGSCVLDVVPERDRKAADTLWKKLPDAQRAGIAAVAMDMWDPFMDAAREHAPQADIVHDKFHGARYLGKAVDDVRRKEHRELRESGSKTLTGTKYLWLMNPANWNDRQQLLFRALKGKGLKVGRAWAIKEAFARFWNYVYEGSAKNFFRRWYFWATHSRLKPVIEAAKTLRRHLPGLLAYLRHRITNAVTEGLNSKIQTLKANARGFRNFEHYRISILFHCGKLQLCP
jgi:transposase